MCMTSIHQEFHRLKRSSKALHAMLTRIDKEKLWVNPDCGLKTRGVPETDASLRNMVAAAKQIRK